MLVLHADSLDSPTMVKLNSYLLQLEDHIVFIDLLKYAQAGNFHSYQVTS